MSEPIDKFLEHKLDTTEGKYSQSLFEARSMDYAIVYAIATRFALPFEKWKAFKLGIIDKDGNIIRPLKTEEDNRSFSPLDNIVCRIKKLIPKYCWYLLTFTNIFRGFISYSSYKGLYYLNEKKNVEKMEKELLILEEKDLAIKQAKKEVWDIIKKSSRFTEEEFWSHVANLRNEE